MTDQETLKTVQLFYAGLMVDAAANFEHFAITDKVAAKKAREQALAAPAQLAQLGIKTPAELFQRFGAIFGCAKWVVTEESGGTVTAQTSSCVACAIAKRRGGGKPCDLYCINPFRGLTGALQPARTLEVSETLWDGQRCTLTVR